ncbi:hypothetical protein D5086_028426, partial [Populus alba]
VSFGKKYREGDSGRKFKKLLEEFGAVLGVFNVRDFIPWLGWINHLTGLNARVEWVFKELDRFLDEVIEESKANRDMFAAGTDTTQTALEWTMTELLKHPEVVKKAQDEIRRITGSKKSITLASLLHKFNWALPGGAKPQDLDITEAPGLTIHRKFPLVVIATPHSF